MICAARQDSCAPHLLRRTEVSQQIDAMGHVWTAPAVQEQI